MSTAFPPTIGELDLHLFAEGRHEQLWRMLGSHHRTHHGVTGTSFAVWAPHAQAVRIVGSHNGWDGHRDTLRRLDDTGVWETFLPGVGPGTVYKFEILTASGDWVQRADPFARETEHPPATASIVTDSAYEWADTSWMESRVDPYNRPMSVYEVHLGSWRPGLGYRELADALIEYVAELGFTHVEFMPVAEHPFGGSWGYQVTGYYAPTKRFGSPDDFRYLVDRLHQAHIGVILDWVPAHFPKDEWALARFDGEPLFEHPDPRRGEQHDWGTLVFDFGHPQVKNFLVANALYWLEEFHIDGLRVDAVASMLYLDYSRTEWEPNILGGRENLEAIRLLQEVNATAYRRHPGIVMIAEESTSFPGVTAPTSSGGLGFGLKWNMGWMHDSLSYVRVDPLYRAHHRHDMTFSFDYAFSENFISPISHDEVVHGKGSLWGKMPGDHWQKFATVRAYLAFMWAHPGKQLLFMGCEFAQPSEWSEEHGLDWAVLDNTAHRDIHRLVSELNRNYRERPALYDQDSDPAGFAWVNGGSSDPTVIAWQRMSRDGDMVVVAANFSGVPIRDFVLSLPHAGVWHEILNTDAHEFGGSGVGNLGSLMASSCDETSGAPAARVTLPPLGVLWFAPAL